MAGLASRSIAVCLLALFFSGSAQGQSGPPLVADLIEEQVSITLGFSGTDLLLFGATDEIGDIVVVVRGPTGNVTVRRKERIGGIWVNRDHATFDEVPGFYLIASTGPINETVPLEIRRNKELGLDMLSLDPTEDITQEESEAFRAALIRNKQRQGLYAAMPGSVELQSGRLFRTNVTFPSNVPTGIYTVEVILLRDDKIVEVTLTPLVVDRRGFEALVFSFAHVRPMVYGLFAILIALIAGWFAGFAFRKI